MENMLPNKYHVLISCINNQLKILSLHKEQTESINELRNYAINWVRTTGKYNNSLDSAKSHTDYDIGEFILTVDTHINWDNPLTFKIDVYQIVEYGNWFNKKAKSYVGFFQLLETTLTS